MRLLPLLVAAAAAQTCPDHGPRPLPEPQLRALARLLPERRSGGGGSRRGVDVPRSDGLRDPITRVTSEALRCELRSHSLASRLLVYEQLNCT